MKRRTIMINNFLGGIAWGLGSVIGASVVVGIIGYLLNVLGIWTAFSKVFIR